MTQSREQAAALFVRWLSAQINEDARGATHDALDVEPSGRFWMGTLAPEEAVLDLGWGDRGERLDPCAVGIVFRPEGEGPWAAAVDVRMRAWQKVGKQWSKGPEVHQTIPLEVPNIDFWSAAFGQTLLADRLSDAVGIPGLQAEIRAQVEASDPDGTAVAITLVNTSPKSHDSIKDTRLYETSMTIRDISYRPFQLVGLPDTFRFDRSVPAYGINCGVLEEDASLTTSDTIEVDDARRDYFADGAIDPTLLRFADLAEEPLSPLTTLVGMLETWGESAWSDRALQARAVRESWTAEVQQAAADAAADFEHEVERIKAGLDLLRSDPVLLRCFCLMNQAISHSSAGKFEGWRPFQLGFLLANITALATPDTEADTADVVWFATGGGKTETYLGLIVMAAFFDRLRGKAAGITAWSRFPLRMLSLQQTQRFADAMAGAELARQAENIPGDPFSVGFFVGEGATPNRVRLEPHDGEFDYEDDDAPARYKVLLYCPFCRSDVNMRFNRLRWCLEHRCTSMDCPWGDSGIPFYIVDDDIYRYLPTVVVGTLDKAASISVQASMRGFVGPPRGQCSVEGHGFTYATRADRKTGCLVPGCRGSRVALEIDDVLFAPSFRLQDELHLLRDSLGAVDAHYEAILDELQLELSGFKPKILASSATLSGFEKQVSVLYQRSGRVFPAQGPTANTGFWSSATERLARRFVALAPRGVTAEFAIDRLVTVLQQSVRRLEPDGEAQLVCQEAGVDLIHREFLLSNYGVNVVYGNTLRDLEAVARSLETQIAVSPLGTRRLTGQTDFDEVRDTLSRLEHPESEFNDRIHVITASSMMSHGVDIDRLNVMIVIGMPLTTAEFIQATARVGRTWPGLVFVIHKIARERDASVFRAFPKFISQGDRFVEPVPVTRRSRRVLDRTLPGIEMARILAMYEPRSSEALTRISRLREFFKRNGINAGVEAQETIKALGLSGGYDELLTRQVEDWSAVFFENVDDGSRGDELTPEAFPEHRPMRSLRDVEEQLTIRD